MQSIRDIAKKIAEILPDSLTEIKTDFENRCREILQTQLSKLDLVTQEQFEIQSKVLARTREKIEQLEKRLADLENRSK